MTDELYRKLQEHLDGMSLGFPAAESGVDQDILKNFFSVEEAKFFLTLDHLPQPIEAIAQKAGKDTRTAQELVDGMVKKGTLFFLTIEGNKLYMPAPFAHGFFEASAEYMDERLAGLFDRYFKERFYDLLRDLPEQTAFRIAPVNEAVPGTTSVMPNDDVVALLKSKDKIAVFDCACKVQEGLVGNPTDKPLEVCFAFDWLADYYDERGQGRIVPLEEALRIQEQCEEAGLINNVTNLKDSPALCHCCERCLGIRSIKHAPKPAEIVASNYFAEVDESLCIGCEECIDRCQIDALSMGAENLAVINPDRCIGCGVCVSACPESALSLKQKSQVAKEPIDLETFAEQVATHRGTGIQTKLFHDGK